MLDINTYILFGLIYALAEGMKTIEEFRYFAALQLLKVLIGSVENPAKTAVFWADALLDELNKDRPLE